MVCDTLANIIVVGRSISNRSDIFITTKYMPSHQVHPSSSVYEMLQKSLPKLNGKKKQEDGAYIDLVLIHAPWGGEEGRKNNWEALKRAQKEGWMRDIGVSNL
jgi:diketogulonate reductase-like aldo/keto reductase